MHDSKICFKCEIDKPLSEFYKHKEMQDGHLNKCKNCTKLDTKANTLKNYDYYAEYDRQRAMIPHRVEARQKYSQTEQGKAAFRKAREKWGENNVIKRAASIIVGNAVRDGKIVKEYKCQNCAIQNARIHGHHDDYAYPMIVRWLCAKCHTKWHKQNGSGLNG